MKSSLLAFTFILAIAVSASAQKDEVNNAVLNYVDAFYYGDTTKIHQSIAPNVMKYGYYIPKNKTAYEGEPMSFRDMINYAASVAKKGPNAKAAQWPKKIEVFDVQDQTASAKLTAWWGTDYILLAKLNGKWMITNVVWQSPPKS